MFRLPGHKVIKTSTDAKFVGGGGEQGAVGEGPEDDYDGDTEF